MKFTEDTAYSTLKSSGIAGWQGKILVCITDAESGDAPEAGQPVIVGRYVEDEELGAMVCAECHEESCDCAVEYETLEAALAAI